MAGGRAWANAVTAMPDSESARASAPARLSVKPLSFSARIEIELDAPGGQFGRERLPVRRVENPVDFCVLAGGLELQDRGVVEFFRIVALRRPLVPQVAAIEREAKRGAFAPQQAAHEAVAQRDRLVPARDRRVQFQDGFRDLRGGRRRRREEGGEGKDGEYGGKSADVHEERKGGGDAQQLPAGPWVPAKNHESSRNALRFPCSFGRSGTISASRASGRFPQTPGVKLDLALPLFALIARDKIDPEKSDLGDLAARLGAYLDQNHHIASEAVAIEGGGSHAGSAELYLVLLGVPRESWPPSSRSAKCRRPAVRFQTRRRRSPVFASSLGDEENEE